MCSEWQKKVPRCLTNPEERHFSGPSLTKPRGVSGVQLTNERARETTPREMP